MSIRKRTRKRYYLNHKKGRNRSRKIRSRKIRSRKRRSRKRRSRKRRSRKIRSRYSVSRKKMTGGGEEEPSRILKFLIKDYTWDTIDDEIVQLVKHLMKHLELTNIGDVTVETMTTAHAYIILHYFFHKLRPAASDTDGSYSYLYHSYGLTLKKELQKMGTVKDEVEKHVKKKIIEQTTGRDSGEVPTEAAKSLGGMGGLGAALSFQTLTPGGIGAVASAAGVSATVFIFCTAGVALIPIIAAMLAANSTMRSDWRGEVFSNYHLRSGSQSTMVDGTKRFVKQLLPALGKEFNEMFPAEYRNLPKSTSDEDAIYERKHAWMKENVKELEDLSEGKPLADYFIHACHQMMVSKQEQSEGDVQQNITKVLTEFKQNKIKAFNLKHSMILIQSFVTYYFRHRSTEVVKEVELLQKNVEKLKTEDSTLSDNIEQIKRVVNELQSTVEALPESIDNKIRELDEQTQRKITENSETIQAVRSKVNRAQFDATPRLTPRVTPQVTPQVVNADDNPLKRSGTAPVKNPTLTLDPVKSSEETPSSSDQTPPSSDDTSSLGPRTSTSPPSMPTQRIPLNTEQNPNTDGTPGTS